MAGYMAAYGPYGYLLVGAMAVGIVGLILAVIENRFRRPGQRRAPMTMDSRQLTEAHRVYYEEEIERMICRMKIEGGTLEDCTRELHLLADFVRAQAEGLAEAWPELLHDTYYEIWKKRRESPDAK
jgi:hypothetical protein